jgi:hypothetical protein
LTRFHFRGAARRDRQWERETRRPKVSENKPIAIAISQSDDALHLVLQGIGAPRHSDRHPLTALFECDLRLAEAWAPGDVHFDRARDLRAAE